MIQVYWIFSVLKINELVNYLLLNKYGNVFQYEMKGLKFYLLKINWKWIIEIDLDNRIFIDILECKFTMEFINEKGNLFKNKRWFIFEVWK